MFQLRGKEVSPLECNSITAKSKRNLILCVLLSLSFADGLGISHLVLPKQTYRLRQCRMNSKYSHSELEHNKKCITMMSLGHLRVSLHQQCDSFYNGLFRLFMKAQAPKLRITTSTFDPLILLTNDRCQAKHFDVMATSHLICITTYITKHIV